MDSNENEISVGLMGAGVEGEPAFKLTYRGEKVILQENPTNAIIAIVGTRFALTMLEKDPNTIVNFILAGRDAVVNAGFVEYLLKDESKKDTDRIYIQAFEDSYSTPTDIKKVAENARGEVTIICQGFAETRTRIHADYYLEGQKHNVRSLEYLVEKLNPLFSRRELAFLDQLLKMRDVSLVNKLSEIPLQALAIIFPKTGGVDWLTKLRLEGVTLEKYFRKKNINS